MFTKDYFKLKKLQKLLYFTIEDLADAFNIKPESARVFCSRYAKKGLLIRLKRNFYTLYEKWENNSQEDFLKISNFLQVPSYISFMTALSFYEVTSQIQRNFFENTCLKRTAKYEIKGVILNFYKLNKKYYFNFVKKGDIFIATKEKAFLDAIYLYSFGKYKIDFSSLDLDKLDKTKIKKLLKVYPQKTKRIVSKLCKI